MRAAGGAETHAADLSTDERIVLFDGKSLEGRPMDAPHGNIAIRDGKWKLGEGHLFHLENDLRQTTNVAKTDPELVKRMSGTLADCKETGRSRPAKELTR